MWAKIACAKHLSCEVLFWTWSRQHIRPELSQTLTKAKSKPYYVAVLSDHMQLRNEMRLFLSCQGVTQIPVFSSLSRSVLYDTMQLRTSMLTTDVHNDFLSTEGWCKLRLPPKYRADANHQKEDAFARIALTPHYFNFAPNVRKCGHNACLTFILQSKENKWYCQNYTAKTWVLQRWFSNEMTNFKQCVNISEKELTTERPPCCGRLRVWSTRYAPSDFVAHVWTPQRRLSHTSLNETFGWCAYMKYEETSIHAIPFKQQSMFTWASITISNLTFQLGCTTSGYRWGLSVVQHVSMQRAQFTATAPLIFHSSYSCPTVSMALLPRRVPNPFEHNSAGTWKHKRASHGVITTAAISEFHITLLGFRWKWLLRKRTTHLHLPQRFSLLFYSVHFSPPPPLIAKARCSIFCGDHESFREKHLNKTDTAAVIFSDNQGRLFSSELRLPLFHVPQPFAVY